MFDFCKDEHEIACILAHEIAHNELGHIKEGISKSKTYDEYLGKHFGSFSVFVANLITLSFNQKNEAHCDMWGIDLAYRCNYLPCHTVSLWKRMKTIEGDTPDELSAILSTHPYSGRRADCVKNHLKTNYKINCTE
jgi:predicted Zn-dependent protease